MFSLVAPSVPPPCNDNNACTADACVGGGTQAAFCRNTPEPSGTVCADGNACNGDELCDGFGQCQPGTNVSEGTSCSDSNACNGDETCSGFGTCLAGAPPEVNDRNPCTADACDAADGVIHVPLPDGTRCSGAGVCEAGVCSVQGTVFSEDFFQFQNAPAQCDRWNDFLDNQLVAGDFSSVTMSGTFDLNGVTCSDPTAATQICRALHNHSTTSVSCNGHVWNVGQCGGIELAVDNPVCFCTFGQSHTVRPCTFSDWGGVGTETCSGPTQNMTVVCE